MAAVALPTKKAVHDVLEGLLGRDVTLTYRDEFLSTNDNLIVARYTDDLARTSACVAVDIPLAVFLGAAVGLGPPPVAKEMAAAGELVPMFEENVGEVLNILSALFHTGGAEQVTLNGLSSALVPLPADTAKWLASSVGRMDVDVDISGYGSGRMTLVTNT
jgi:hypothetical protein